METILDRLKAYFDNTPDEKIELDWEKTKKYDEVNSPTVEEFLRASR